MRLTCNALAALVGAVVTAMPAAAWAATLTVNTAATPINGSDTKCGIFEAIHAINIAADYSNCTKQAGTTYGANDTIILNANTYNITSFLQPTRSVIIKGATGNRDDVIIDARNGYEEAIYLDDQASSPLDVTVQGLTLKSVSTKQFMTGIQAVGTCPDAQCENLRVTLRNMRVTGFTSSGIQMWGKTYLATFDTLIDHNSGTSGGGLVVTSDSGLSDAFIQDGTVIEYNTATDGGGAYIGGKLNLLGTAAKPVIIRNNTATNQGGGIAWITDALHPADYYIAYCSINQYNTFQSNQATTGGGFYGHSPALTSDPNASTFTTNTASNCKKYRWQVASSTVHCVN